MVHALHEVHRVLLPGGTLIDLRPTTTNRTVEVDLSYARLCAGEIDSSGTVADREAADAALRGAIAAGRFRAEHKETFFHMTDMDSVADLRDYAATMRGSVLPKDVVRRVETAVEGEAEDFSIRTRREIVIARYRKI